MPGLKQAGIIAYNRLKKLLEAANYCQYRYILSLWKHDHLPISFTLVVDDLGVKYIDEKTAKHLSNMLWQQYEISEE